MSSKPTAPLDAAPASPEALRPGRPRRRLLLRVHRSLSLAVCLFWVLQALTGLALVFRVEIDNALTPGAAAPLDPTAMGEALASLPRQLGVPVVSLTAADRAAGRYDAFDEGDRRVARLSGRGELVAEGHRLDTARRFDDLLSLHQSLWAGDAGTAAIGASALLLLSNITLGLSLGWPRPGGIRRALVPPKAPPGAAATLQRHRATGLWFAGPALVLVLGGAAMALGDPWSDRLGADRRPPHVTPSGRPLPITFQAAVETALQHYPGARISVINLPSAETPRYRFRLRQTGELQRFYGGTEIFVDARSGAVLASYDGRRAPAMRTLFDAFYPVHTMEFLGLPGRLLAAAVGAWLLTMTFLGLRLWRARRRMSPMGRPRLD